MIRKLLLSVSNLIRSFLNRPFQVFIFCSAFFFVGLVIDGSLFRLWILRRDAQDLVLKIENIKEKNQLLEKQIERANDPAFIELQARERFELAEEGDLIFVFANDTHEEFDKKSLKNSEAQNSSNN